MTELRVALVHPPTGLKPGTRSTGNRRNGVVRRLQARIVKATQEGRWNKVRALQRLLTHSYSGKALAVKRVTENRGKRTPGVDGETWTTPARRWRPYTALRQRGYKPQPLRRVYIPKKQSGKLRPLSIPAMLDRAMQALYLLALSPRGRDDRGRSSYGFRPKRSTADAIAKCFSCSARKSAPVGPRGRHSLVLRPDQPRVAPGTRANRHGSFFGSG